MKFLITIPLLLLSVQEGASQSLFARNQQPPPILYKRQEALYDLLYADHYTGAYNPISVWRPGNLQHDFYALGDLAVPNYDFPTTSTVFVKDMSGDALRAPVGVEEIWNDSGSGGSLAVTFYRLIPPEGYVCLGSVALDGYNEEDLDISKYRCVKDTYVTTGKYEFIWDDTGSGAYDEFTARANRQSSSDTFGIDAGTFTGFSDYTDPEDPPYLLNGTAAQNVLDYNLWNPEAVITIYEMPDAEAIYDDSYTGADEPIQVWRSRTSATSYSLGDFATTSDDYSRAPTLALAAKATQDGVFDAPSDFLEIWNDVGTGGSKAGVFYKPSCNPGYRAIGHVVSSTYDEPAKSTIRCVNEKYTMRGDSWEWVWNDVGTGANMELTVYRALPTNDGQGVGAISFTGSYDEMDEPPYVLNPAFVNYVTGRPVMSYSLSKVEYQLDTSDVHGKEPESIARQTVVNKDPDSPQTAHHKIDYEYTEEYTWNNHMGGEIGMSMEVTAGIPFLAQATYGVSASASYENEWGGSTSTSIVNSITCDVTVNPCKTVVCTVSGTRYTMDVPYTATLRTVYDDGTTGVREDVEGVFRGVEVMDVMVYYEPGDPVPDCVPTKK